MENCTDRESYALAAGLALGLIMFGVNTLHKVKNERVHTLTYLSMLGCIPSHSSLLYFYIYIYILCLCVSYLILL